MRRPLAVGVVVFVAGCGGGYNGAERSPSSPENVARNPHPDCNIGARHPWERGTTILACGGAPDGRRIRIGAFRDAAGPCLVIFGLPAGPRQCGRAPSERIPPGPTIGGAVIARITRESHLELYGETRPAVRRVTVRFRLPSGQRRRRTATIIRVEDRDALREAQIRKPFGYFAAFVPPQARKVVAVGRDADGVALGRLRYDPIVDSLHPHNFIARRLRRTSS